MCWASRDGARGTLRQALAYAADHEVYNLAAYVATTIAWLRLRAGEWDEAERVTRRDRQGHHRAQLLAKTVLTELAVRRGDPDASDRLADLAGQADRSGELQRVAPVVELATESALTTGAPMPIERLGALVEQFRPRGGLTGWSAIRVAGMGGRRGIDLRSTTRHRRRTPRCSGATGCAAADGFGEVGWHTTGR